MDNRMDIANVLADIRAVRAQMAQSHRIQAEALPQKPGVIEGTAGRQAVTEAPGFGDMLKQAVSKVDQMQQSASDLRNAYVKGEPDVDLAKVMIASQKSSLAFQALTQVRNRVVQTYEDIMKMPI
ncbi:MAG: flagellar hook-basal body complex protein FliE [Hahellaceae bacterium]|nr:flagellar hook-basal body complex protein FliE [Hahellaceae bacterium]